jgi:hypothetical protein
LGFILGFIDLEAFLVFEGAARPPQTPNRPSYRMKVKKSGVIFRLPQKFQQSMAKKSLKVEF